jgi:phosphoglycolate phosphatase-like HAD superfamily hydrolase
MSVISNPAKAIELIQSKQLLVYDFDGVLADSVEVKTEAFAEIYKSYGSSVVNKVVDHHRRNGGMSRFEKFRHYHNIFLQQDIDEKMVEELSQSFSKTVVDKVIASPEICGSDRFIKQYNRRLGCISVINSATPTDEVKKIVSERGIFDSFDAIYGSPNSKTDNLLSIREDFSIDFDKGVFFGDAESDFKAAQSIGMDFIGIGSTIAKLLNDVDGQWFVFDDFIELVDGD